MDASTINAIIARHRERPGALLPILHDIQDAHGFVPPEAVPLIAGELDLSRAEVHGVITFYHHFRSQRSGSRHLQVCRGEACQARGVDILLTHVRAVLGCELNETSADGKFLLEPVYCLGQCACGPALTVDDRLYVRMTADKFDDLVNAMAERS
jgi:formate dehydrogenase subunit gamma